MVAGAPLLFAVALAAASPCDGAPPSPALLALTIDGLRSGSGQITIVVYGDQPEDFLAKGRRLIKVRVPADAPTVSTCLALPRTGIFALAAYHDEDGDGRFDRTIIGTPSEGFAFSNDAPALLGLPSFSAVAFSARAGVNPMTIHLRYP